MGLLGSAKGPLKTFVHLFTVRAVSRLVLFSPSGRQFDYENCAHPGLPGYHDGWREGAGS